MRYTLLVIILLIVGCTNKQSNPRPEPSIAKQKADKAFQNVEQKIENGRVVITYDLMGGVHETYDIIITAEKDGKTVTPRAIAGDLTGIKPGTAHEIWWEPVLEGRDLLGWSVSLASRFVCIDIDGNIYETVQIGNQVWTAENLMVTHYRNGDAIPTGHSNSEWSNLSTGAYAVYDNNKSNADTYGYLYNWYVVDDSRNIAPEGWHIPTDEEWTELVDYLGNDAGSQLAGRADLWNNGDLENNTNFGTSGFNALPGGYRYYLNGGYHNMGNDGNYWSSTEYGSYDAWARVLGYDNSDVGRYYDNRRNGFSVRCIRD